MGFGYSDDDDYLTTEELRTIVKHAESYGDLCVYCLQPECYNCDVKDIQDDYNNVINRIKSIIKEKEKYKMKEVNYPLKRKKD